MLGNQNNGNSIQSAEFAEIADSKNGRINTKGGVPFVNVSSVVPYGVAFAVPKGENTVVLPVGNTAVYLGVLQKENDLEAGEIMLYSSGGATVVLKNDGRVLINGREG